MPEDIKGKKNKKVPELKVKLVSKNDGKKKAWYLIIGAFLLSIISKKKIT